MGVLKKILPGRIKKMQVFGKVKNSAESRMRSLEINQAGNAGKRGGNLSII